MDDMLRRGIGTEEPHDKSIDDMPGGEVTQEFLAASWDRIAAHEHLRRLAIQVRLGGAIRWILVVFKIALQVLDLESLVRRELEPHSRTTRPLTSSSIAMKCVAPT
jgi:hypothetical protein